MGGKHFRIPCTISKNGIGILQNALGDSGAGGLIFIDEVYAARVCKHLNVSPIPLDQPVPVRGYNGAEGKPVTHLLVLNLSVDGHRQRNMPMLIVDLGGRNDMIIGRKWFEQFDVMLDLRRKRLVWPEQHAELLPVREIVTKGEQLKPKQPDPSHQFDVYQRDAKFAHEDQRRAAGRASAKKRLPTIEYDSGESDDEEEGGRVFGTSRTGAFASPRTTSPTPSRGTSPASSLRTSPATSPGSSPYTSPRITPIR
jgi:hypothetical protein